MQKTTHQLTLLLLLLSLTHPLNLHNFHSLESAEHVPNSKSIKKLNHCKEYCLKMKQYFPFNFRYHRYIKRQSHGFVKYFVGNCQVLMGADKYSEWKALKEYIQKTNLFGDKDTKNHGQMKIWVNFDVTCENKKLKLDKVQEQALQLQRVHSNFLYYDDGHFKNVQPFNMNDLLNSIAKVIQKR